MKAKRMDSKREHLVVYQDINEHASGEVIDGDIGIGSAFRVQW